MAVPVKDIYKYVTVLAEKLNLQHWNIKVSEDSADDGHYAMIQIMQEYHRALVHIGHLFHEVDEVQQRLSLVHELIHCHMYGMCAVNNSLQSEVSPPAWRIAKVLFAREDEIATDAMANLLAPHLPLPHWHKSK